MNQFCRTELLIGKENIEKLQCANILVFGVGGVGSYVVEGLIRSGIGNITLIDGDVVCESNINRQLVAFYSTIGKDKVEVAKSRILDINPNVNILIYKEFITTENAKNFINNKYSYIVDAIDTVSAKLAIIEIANSLNIPIISCMGTGNKLNPEMLEISNISKTSVCPLAKVMRKELRKRNIDNLKVLYSKEEPLKPTYLEDFNSDYDISKKLSPGSISFVPSCAGLMIAGEVIRSLISKN